MGSCEGPVTPFYDLYWRRPHWLFKTILRPFGRKLVPGVSAGGWGREDGPDGSAGVREPRRPAPAAGTGAIALPLDDAS